MPPLPEPKPLDLIVEQRGTLRIAALVSGRRMTDVAVDRLDERRRYQSIWRARIDRIVPHVGAFVALDVGAGLLREAKRPSGEVLTVQVKSVRAGGKADILTDDISLPGRYFVYLPRSSGIVSSNRLQTKHAVSSTAELGAALREAGIEGGILRGHALAAGAEAVVAEAGRLAQRWRDIETRAGQSPPGMLVEEGPEAPQRLQADYPERDLHSVCATLDSRGVLDEFDALFRPEIRLPRGGSVMIEETSALTAIDVNAGTRPPAEVDREALAVIADQIRLRNLSGLILIDFAAAGSKKAGASGEQWLQLVRRTLADDPARCRVAGLTPAGLVELTRPGRDLPLAGKCAGDLDGRHAKRR